MCIILHTLSKAFFVVSKYRGIDLPAGREVVSPKKTNSANNRGYELIARLIVEKFENIYRGVEKWYLTRLITLRRPFESGPRNK